jgi:hypothetical protein
MVFLFNKKITVELIPHMYEIINMLTTTATGIC